MILKSTVKTCSADPYRQPPDAAIPGRPDLGSRLLVICEHGVRYLTGLLVRWCISLCCGGILGERVAVSCMHHLHVMMVAVCIINLHDERDIPPYQGTTFYSACCESSTVQYDRLQLSQICSSISHPTAHLILQECPFESTSVLVTNESVRQC